MQRFIGLMILLAAGIGVYFSITNVLWQHQANRYFEAVPAQIIGTPRIVSHKGSKGSVTYSPEATYSYEFKGRQFQSTRVLALTFSTSSRSWAQGVLARIERTGPGGPDGGFASTAYVNPQHPEQAILVREYSFLPYGFGMGTLFAAAVGLGMLAGVIGTARTKMAAVALDDSGWQLLLPQIQVRKQLRNAVIWLIGGAAALVPLPGHWVFVAGQSGVATVIGGLVVLAVVGGLAMVLYRRWSVSHHLSDARVRIRPAPMRRGEPLALEVGIDAYAPLRVTRMTARILCTEHYKESHGNKVSYGTRTRAEKTVPLCGAAAVPAGGEVAGNGEVTFDRNLPPTTDLVVKSYPYFTWEIKLALVLEGMVDYAAVFPLEVD